MDPKMTPSPPPPERASRSTTIFLALGFVVVALFLVLDPSKLYRAFKYEDKPAPALTLPDLLSQKPVSLAEFEGKVVLLDFWATWCPPCRKQMPILQKLQDDPTLKDSLKILSINVDEDDPGRSAKVISFLHQNGFTLTTLEDDGSAYANYSVASIPTLVVVSPTGHVVDYHQGLFGEDALRQIISKAR